MLTLPRGTRPTRSALPIALAPSRRAVGTPTLILTVNIGCSAWAEAEWVDSRAVGEYGRRYAWVHEGSTLSETDRWEALALGTVGAFVGVEVEVWDADGRQGVPDGRFEIDGRIGFVEVTTDANPNARGGRRAYDERATWHMDEVAGSYGVWIDPTVRDCRASR